MSSTDGKDALTPIGIAASLVPQINFELIEKSKNEAAVRLEIANALRNLQQTLNNYITRKGV